MNHQHPKAPFSLLILLVVIGPLGMAHRASAGDGDDEAATGAAAEVPPDKGDAKIDPVDAASLANDINQDHCVDAYNSDISVAAESTKEVLDAWANVDLSYKQYHENYLLFWRGVLAQCLGRNDNAGEDLQQFVRVQSERGGFQDLIQQANNRLKRLGYAKEHGIGPAGNYLQGHQIVEGSLVYGGGLFVQLQHCTTDNDSYVDAACVGATGDGKVPVYLSGLGGQPAGFRAAAAVYPLKFLGVGARYTLGITTPTEMSGGDSVGSLPYEQQVGPLWTLLAGPILRIQPPISAGTRGVRLQLMPSFLARHEQFTPLAGLIASASGGSRFLFPGTFSWTRYGLATWMEIAVEVRTTLVFRIGGQGGWVLGAKNSGLRESSSLDADQWDTVHQTIEMTPEVDKLSSGFAGFHLGLLGFGKDDHVAIEPTLKLGWSFSSVAYDFVESDRPGAWYAEPEEEDQDPEASVLNRKRYSTRQDRFTLMFEIGIRLGAGKKK